MTNGKLAVATLLLLSTINTELLLSTVNTAAQPQTNEVTLKCGGEITIDTTEQNPKSVTNLGLVVNLAKKTVTGFVGVVASIYKTDDATISFEGEGPVSYSDNIQIGTNSVVGNIDRITGRVIAETTFTSSKTLSTSSWELSCTPTTRLLPYQLSGEAAMADCTKQLADLSPRDAWQCMWQSKRWKAISGNINETLDRLSNKTIGEWINVAVASAATIKTIVETIIFVAIVIAPEFASYVLPFIFIKSLLQRFSGLYSLALRGSEKKKCMFWGIYLLTTGAGMVLIGRNNLFALLQGGWECFVGVAIFVLGPNWWGTYSRMDSAVAVNEVTKRTRKAAVIALRRHLDQLDVSKHVSENY